MSRINKASVDNRIDIDVLMKRIVPAINDNFDRIEALERMSHAAPTPKAAPAPAAKAPSKKAASKKK